jgi:LysM repeat protein
MPSDWAPSPTFKRLPDGVIWAQGRRESDGGARNSNKASRGMFQPELPIFKRLVKRFPAQMKGITWEGLSNNVEHAHKVRDLTDLLNAKDFNNRYGRLPTIKETLMMYKEGLDVFNQPKNSETYQRGRQYVNNIVKDLFYHNPTYAKKVFPELVNYKDIPLVPLKAIPKTSSPINTKTMPKNPSNMYTVQSGDNLGKIVANRGIRGATNIYNMVNKIKKINNLNSDVLRPNQQLKLPEGL